MERVLYIRSKSDMKERNLEDYIKVDKELKRITGMDIFQIKEMFSQGYTLASPDSTRALLEYFHDKLKKEL